MSLATSALVRLDGGLYLIDAGSDGAYNDEMSVSGCTKISHAYLPAFNRGSFAGGTCI